MPIYIGDRWIDKIYGPASLRVLRPIEKSSPLIFLFGDIHNSFEGGCSDCTCAYSTESCCYRSFDPEFLQLLDSLSSPSRKVKIFVEAFTRLINRRNWHAMHNREELDIIESGISNLSDDILIRGKRVGQPLPSFWAGHQLCFFQTKDKTAYNRFCPTRNIEWHFADARGKSSLDRGVGKPGRFVNDFEYQVFSQFYGITRMFHSGARSLSIELPQHAEFAALLVEAIYDHQRVKKCVEVLFKRSDSLVVKQALQYSKASGVRMKKIQEWIKEFLLHLVVTTPDVVEKIDDRLLRDLPKYIRGESVRKEYDTNTINHALLNLVQLTSCFLDLYFVFRGAKKEDSWLNLLVAGEEHCKNIEHLLCVIMKSHVLGGFEGAHGRCLNLKNFTLDLNKEAGFAGRIHSQNYSTYERSLVTNLDKARGTVLGEDLLAEIINSRKMPTDDDLRTASKEGPEAIKNFLQLQDFLKELDARDALDIAKDEGSALNAVKILCKSSSLVTEITRKDLTGFVSKGWQMVIEKISKCNAQLASDIVRTAIVLNKPDLALKTFQAIQENFQPQSLKPQGYIDVILQMLEKETNGKRYPFDIFDTYLPLLASFRGYINFDRAAIMRLLDTHKKFHDGFVTGKLSSTFDDYRIPPREIIRVQNGHIVRLF
jgi:hypothetical protein